MEGLKEIRIRLGYTQEEVAKRFGVSQALVSSWESRGGPDADECAFILINTTPPSLVIAAYRKEITELIDSITQDTYFFDETQPVGIHINFVGTPVTTFRKLSTLDPLIEALTGVPTRLHFLP